MQYLWKRLNEGSTWSAISAATAAIGVGLGSGATLWASLIPALVAILTKDK